MSQTIGLSGKPSGGISGAARFRPRRLAVLAALGFSSGLPLLLVGQTLVAWMTAEQVDIKQIAAFSAVGLPYTFKFLWAPLLDRYQLPFLGRRRGWALVLQLALGCAIFAMSASRPADSPYEFAVAAVIVAFLSASQDVVLDAYNADLLSPEQRAAGSAVYVVGYRIAWLTTGTLALILADIVSWKTIYTIMALLMSVGVIATLFAEEPQASSSVRPRSLKHALVLPFSRFVSRLGPRNLVVVLLFVMTYKFGDFLVDALKITFFKRELGFSFTQTALSNVLCVAAIVLGGVIVGFTAPRLGVKRSLLLFGILQSSTNFLYALLALLGKSYLMLGAAVFFDHLTGAMGAAAFVAFLMALCDQSVSATQFALLTSLSSLGSRAFGWIAAPIIEHIGWAGFFASTAAMALPGLLLISKLDVATRK